MPLAALFIGGVLPALLRSLIRKRAGYMKKEKRSSKLQAPSLTVTEGYYRINLKRRNMDTIQLKRIADALEEILRLVKKDMEPRTKEKK
jgi:hypothetical protein